LHRHERGRHSTANAGRDAWRNGMADRSRVNAQVS
jgi:hypothetical protein